MRASWLALLLTASLSAQELRLDLELAADPQRRGPAAWTFFREQVLPQLLGSDAPPLGPLHIRVKLPYDLVVRKAQQRLQKGLYLRGTVQLPIGSLRGVGDFSGRETWQGRVALPSAGRLGHLWRILPVQTGSICTLDMPTLIGNLMVGARCSGTMGLFLGIGSAECGTVHLQIAMEGHNYARIRSLTGRSRSAGLLLPAALVLAADLQARPRGGTLMQGPVGSELDRFLLAARAARGDIQFDAVARLGSSRDPRATDCLRDLMSGSERLRQLAMASLQGGAQFAGLGTEPLAAAGPAVSIWWRVALLLGGFLPLGILAWTWVRREQACSLYEREYGV